MVDGDYRCVPRPTARVQAWAVLVASGSTYRRLGIPGEDDFIGAGVHFCATCDGAFYRDREVLVVGGGNSAGEEGIFLTKFASKVTIVTRDKQLSASKVVVEKVNSNPKIELITDATPSEFKGDKKLASVVIKSKDGGERELKPAGVFVFIGLSPNTEAANGLVDVDERGFIGRRPGTASPASSRPATCVPAAPSRPRPPPAKSAAAWPSAAT